MAPSIAACLRRSASRHGPAPSRRICRGERITDPAAYSEHLRGIYRNIRRAHHRIVPDFQKTRTAEDTIDRGIGIFRLREMVYQTKLIGVEREVKKEGATTEVTYHTPVGAVSFKTLYTEKMKQAGISQTWISEHVIKKPEDYAVVGHIFKNIKISPAYESYSQYEREVGDRGFVAAWASTSASPMHHILKHFFDSTTFLFRDV